MLLAPLSEICTNSVESADNRHFYGRRPIYNISLVLFTIWIIPCAVAQNIQTMLIARFFNGVAGSAFLSVAGGTVGDLFSRAELAAPMMVFTISPFLGPSIGPIIGGPINFYVSWFVPNFRHI
jgi:MFS family permease